MKVWTQEIRSFFDTAFSLTKGYTIIEVICIALLSVSSSQTDSWNSPWTLLILVSCVVLVITYIQRYNFLNKFPKSLIDSVEQSINLKDVEIQRKESEIERIKVERSKSRSGLIHDAISKTIVGLNNQTCSLSAKENIEEIATKLCDKDVQDGLAQILEPLISEIYTIVEEEDSQVLMGVYFKDIAQDRGDDSGLPPSYPYFFTFKNDIEDIQIPSDIVGDKSVIGDLLKLQQAIDTCLRNNIFVSQNMTLGNEHYQVIVSPIPYACNEEEADGAFLFVLRNANYPKDFEKIIKVFNRLLTNWMYKYNSCVYNRSADLWQEFHDDQGNRYQLFYNDRFKYIEAQQTKPAEN